MPIGCELADVFDTAVGAGICTSGIAEELYAPVGACTVETVLLLAAPLPVDTGSIAGGAVPTEEFVVIGGTLKVAKITPLDRD